MGAVLMDDHNDWSAAQRLFDMTEYFDNLPQIKVLLRRAA
jgi:DTW domain-containing protein YfiP